MGALNTKCLQAQHEELIFIPSLEPKLIGIQSNGVYLVYFYLVKSSGYEKMRLILVVYAFIWRNLLNLVLYCRAYFPKPLTCTFIST